MRKREAGKGKAEEDRKEETKDGKGKKMAERMKLSK